MEIPLLDLVVILVGSYKILELYMNKQIELKRVEPKRSGKNATVHNRAKR